MANIFNRFMGLFSGKATQQIVPENRVWGDRLDALIEHAIVGPGRITPGKAFELYRESSIVSTAIEIIAKKAESIRPVIVRQDGSMDDSDPILEFLQRPNDFEVFRGMIATSFRNYLITGNLYWLANGLTGRPPLEVYNGSPIEVAPFTTVQDGYPENYDVSGLLANGRYSREPIPGASNGVRFVRDDDMWHLYHLKDYTTRVNQLTGDSPLQSIIQEIRQHLAGNRHNENMLSQGARLSMLFAIKEDLPKETFDEVEEKIIERFGGSKNAGKIGVVASSELEVQEFGVNNKDMDYVNLAEMVRSSVVARFGIPLPLVVSSRQTFNNFQGATLSLYDDAVLPLVDTVYEALTDFLFPRFGRNPAQERLGYDPQSITALRERIIEEIKSMSDLHSLTTNEKRAMLPGVDKIEGGDVVLGPSTLAPIAGSGIDPAAMTLEDREAEDEARELANDATRQGMEQGNGNEED